MEIVVRQISGLGNQLFQYAAGKYYARRYGASMRMMLDLPRRWHSYGSPRPFLLSHFSISEPFEVIRSYERLLISERPQLKAALGLAGRPLGIQVVAEEPSQRYRFLEDLPLEKSTRTLYIKGYWQAHRIADDNEQDLRSSLRFREPASGKNLAVQETIAAARTSISLHVRRGDYTLASEGNIALPIEYYRQAIASFQERFNQPSFFVFSDDIPYTRANLPSNLNIVFVDHNDDFSSYEDLRLMSSCQHHIIANSTFSWWGAWLNPRKEKIVYAPKQWLLKSDSVFPDLMPPGWILADIESIASLK